MAREEELLEMLRKMAGNSSSSDGNSDEVEAVIETMFSKEARTEQHRALIRQSFFSVMTWVMQLCGPSNMGPLKEAIEHLRKCMDVVLDNNQFSKSTKIPGVGIMHTMQVAAKDDTD